VTDDDDDDDGSCHHHHRERMTTPDRSMLLPLLLLLLSLAETTADVAVVEDPHLESVREIFEWVDSAEDGFVTSKQSVSRMVPNDVNTPLIVHATEDIAKGELLVQTPWSHILHSETEEFDDRVGWYCGTAWKLASEMKLGRESFYAPYAVYLNEEPDGQLPPQYSVAGKKLLHQIVGTDQEVAGRSPAFDRKDAMDQTLLPERFTSSLNSGWFGSCGADRSDVVANKAAALVVQRADDHILIPAYDAYNHRNNDKHNGVEYMNARTVTTENEHHRTYALRDIRKGEQIFISYNMCEQCGGRIDWGFGTPEMFRDYGFIEWFPQRWWYPSFGDYHPVENDMEINQFDLYQNEDTKDLTVVWTHLTDVEEKLERFRLFLGREIRRLNRLRNVEWADMRSWTPAQWETSGITSYEWSNVNQFLDANVVAMTLALNDLRRGGGDLEDHDADADADRSGGQNPNRSPFTVAPEELEELLKENDHYDPLTEPETDDLGYMKSTCENSVYYEFLGFIDTVPAFHTDRDQLLGYFESYLFNEPKDAVDVCYDINNTVQACSSYRPYHYEHMVHAAARYVPKVRRVLFVGSGDGLLLHEIMKYDDRGLELVVGLELDQSVTRKSARHFGVDPHFDHPNVDWWFGGAARSLAVLPEDFKGSFDLVLVDLPVAVLSQPVDGGEVDVLTALRNLVDPETGVFVYNEVFYPDVASRFEHATELHYQSPVVCSESLALGSRGIDFFRAPLHDHGISTMGNLVYTTHPQEEDNVDENHRNALLHHYHSSSCTADGEAEDDADDDDDEADESATAPVHGVLELVTLEGMKEDPRKSMEAVAATVKTVLDDLGFSVLDGGVRSREEPLPMAIVVAEEGYVAARIQEDGSADDAYYLGFDIHLWSRTHDIGRVKDALRGSYPSSVASSHKIVINGGMSGLPPSAAAAKTPAVLPRKKSCGSSTDLDDDDAGAIGRLALEEAIPMALSDDDDAVAVVVFCGSKNDGPCGSREVLEKDDRIGTVIALFDCSGGADFGPSINREDAFDCERDVLQRLSAGLSASKTKKKKLGMIVLDAGASRGMHAIANSVFDTHENRRRFLGDDSQVLAVAFGPTEDPWRLEFLDRFRKQVHHDPVKLADYAVFGGESASAAAASYRFGVVSTRDPGANAGFGSLEKRLRARLPEGVGVELREIRGGLYRYEPEQTARAFTQMDYDTTRAEERVAAQIPLARQVVVQLEAPEDGGGGFFGGLLDLDTAEKLVHAVLDLEGIIDRGGGAPESGRYPVGDGCVYLVAGKSFDAVTVWDGGNRLTVNLLGASPEFLSKPTAGVDVDNRFRLMGFEGIALDSQPRGIGSVSGLPEDLAIIDRDKLALERIAAARENGEWETMPLKPAPVEEDDDEYDGDDDDDEYYNDASEGEL